MKWFNARLAVLAILVACFLLQACRQSNSYEPTPYKLPRVPLVYHLGSGYLRPDSVDTLYRLDSLAQRIYISVRMLDKKAYKLWRVDTMKFDWKNSRSMWDTQKRGYYWTFQDLTASSETIRDKDGDKEWIHDHRNEYFVFHPVRQPEKGQTYPGIDYEAMDEYWFALKSDAAGIASPTDGELFVMAYPIKLKVRGRDVYYPTLEGDSVAVPLYSDHVDSSRMICLRISVMQLND